MWKELIKILNYSNTFISVVAFLLSYGIISLLGEKDALVYSLFVFFSTLATYNFQRLSRADELIVFESEFLNWIRKYKKWIVVIIVVSIIVDLVIFMVYFTLFKPVFFILIIALLLSVLYVFSIKGRSLRSVSYVKMYLIAMIWTLVVGLIPLIIFHQFKFEKTMFVSAHFFLILSLCIPFDVRDLNYDSPDLKTLPQIVGIQSSKVISLILLFVYYFLSYLFIGWDIKLFVFVLFMVFLLLNMSNNRSENYYLVIDLSIGVLGYLYSII